MSDFAYTDELRKSISKIKEIDGSWTPEQLAADAILGDESLNDKDAASELLKLRDSMRKRDVA